MAAKGPKKSILQTIGEYMVSMVSIISINTHAYTHTHTCRAGLTPNIKTQIRSGNYFGIRFGMFRIRFGYISDSVCF